MPVTYFAFDLFQNGRDLRQLPLIERKSRLRKVIPQQTPRLQHIDNIETKGEASGLAIQGRPKSRLGSR